ncbi:chloride channel CLIC-like protein 1 [Portunus trituberculatus]|uniref:chloride channel CLIC-like protein 1 n=1 Tax=Portunus trituberculatus TaxID=210409 RepID=UPI001E1CF303|nr:chloride channel CLIC-like protein 1 [Portunus trituberculatus]
MDPHNMLPDLGGRGGQGVQGRRGQAGRPQGRNAGKAEREKEAEGGGSGGDTGWWAEEEKEEEEEEVKGASKEMSNCVSRLISLQNSLEEEQSTSLKLQKMLAKEGVLDLQAFYRRATQHLWNTLRLQEVGDILKEGNTAVVRQVSVVVTRDNWEGLEEYLRSEADPHKVDEFLREAFTLETPPSDSSPSLLQAAVTLTHTAIQAAKSLEVWLCVLCGGFVALAVWAVVLFVRDIQKELRWGCVLGMMGAVVFFICCLWHWRHMYKMAESRRHAELARRGYAGIPEECQPGSKTSAGTVYDWVKVNLFGSPDVCEKYFEQLMIDAIEEITPGMVIAETVSRFLFQPLQHLGTESGKLTTNFYQNVPPAYHLHATALFLGLLVVVLFYGCAYGIDFPLGLGGYRPMARQDSTAPGNWAGLGREGPQQLVVTSSGILEAQLERLISRHLDHAMEPQHQGVHTITSTPLRSHSQSTTRDMLQQNSPALLGDLLLLLLLHQ